MLKRTVLFICLACAVRAQIPSNPHAVTSGYDSVFVPVDSWIYPALHRLAGMGYIPDQFSSMAPWTRDECVRQVEEADAIIEQHVRSEDLFGADSVALKMITDLRAELNDKKLDDENGIRLQSLYTGFTGITGTPLADSYHFGQTVANNYGRPYGSGLNNVSGASGYANFDRFFVYLRGEYQYAPGSPDYSLGVRQFIASADRNPLLPASGDRSVSRFQPQEMYAGMQLGFENISFGRENLWWGPGQDSAFAFSDNADPFYMLNFDQTRPIVLPSIFRYLGKMRTQFIFGELSGHLWPRKPQVNAQKLTFDVTDNLEVGITLSVFWGGAWHPITLHSFKNSLVSYSSTGCTFRYGDRCDPGDRHTGFDFRWRLPGLRKYVTLYSDSYADDETNPLSNPARSAWGPGIYVAQIPHAEHFDFRFESYDTWINQARNGNFFYWNSQYHDSYTNDGFLLGSYVGRQARAYVGTVDYWMSARTKFQVQVRQLNEPATYLPGRGRQGDAQITAQWGLNSELLLSLSGQAEKYDIPILGPSHKDETIAFSVVYAPRNSVIH